MATKARHIECTLEEYHARSEWSRSQLDTLRQSAQLFHGYYVAKPARWLRDGSKALDIGGVAHTCLTNPGGLSAVVARIPPEVLNSQGHRKGKAWTEWSEENAGRILLKEEEAESIRCMIRNVYAHPIAAKLLGSTLHTEFSLVFSDEHNGLALRARPDLIASGSADGVTLVEFKTTRQIEPRRFLYDAIEFGYHRQLAWYREALEQFGYTVLDNLIVTADKSPAHQCRVYRLSDESLAMGDRENLKARADLARRLAEDDWLDPLDRAICPVDLEGKVYVLPQTQT